MGIWKVVDTKVKKENKDKMINVLVVIELYGSTFDLIRPLEVFH